MNDSFDNIEPIHLRVRESNELVEVEHEELFQSVLLLPINDQLPTDNPWRQANSGNIYCRVPPHRGCQLAMLTRKWKVNKF